MLFCFLNFLVTFGLQIGSVFEYVNQRPVFGILNSDSIFYAPLLGFFAFTGIPVSVSCSELISFLFFLFFVNFVKIEGGEKKIIKNCKVMWNIYS
jgi:hypothetical protein